MFYVMKWEAITDTISKFENTIISSDRMSE